MDTEFDKKKKSPKQRFLFVIGLMFFLIYLSMGLAIIFMDRIPLNIEKKYRIALGVVLIAYACVRGYRIFKIDTEE